MFKFINKIKNKEYSKEKGFSLLELSVAVGVAAIVGAVGIVATTGFIGSAETKKDNYVANAERAIAEAESSSLALGETGSTGGTNSSGEEETPPAPSAPTTVLASDIISTGATLTWAAPETGEVGEYIVTLNGDVQGTEPIPNDVFSYVFTELTVDTYYEAKVFAKSPAGALSEAATTTFISELKPTVATGGDKVYDIVQNGIEYRVHEFTTVGESSFAVANTGETGEVEYLVVAGGGGGGGINAGGGGGGGVLSGWVNISETTYNLTVGSGGLGGLGYSNGNNEHGSKGGNSVAFGLTAIGGGGGASFNSRLTSQGDGGSGGGGGSGPSATNAGSFIGITGQGFQGGQGISRNASFTAEGGGGGGGAGGVGINASNSKANGGPGISSSVTGAETFYAGGGGGGFDTRGANRSGSGGIGGGGAGTYGSVTANNGTNGLGGGGGGAGYSGDSDARNGGTGGSGIVIVRYPVGIVN